MYNMIPKVQMRVKAHPPLGGLSGKYVLDKIGHFPRQGKYVTEIQQK